MQDAHKSWLLFLSFGNASSPLAIGSGWSIGGKNKRKKQETTDLCADTTQHTTTTVSPSQLHQYPISPFFLPLFFFISLFFFFFLFSFQYFLFSSLFAWAPFYFYLSFHTSKTIRRSSAQVVRRGIQPIDMPFIKSPAPSPLVPSKTDCEK